MVVGIVVPRKHAKVNTEAVYLEYTQKCVPVSKPFRKRFAASAQALLKHVFDEDGNEPVKHGTVQCSAPAVHGESK